MLTPEDLDYFTRRLRDMQAEFEAQIGRLELSISTPDEQYLDGVDDRGDDATVLAERDRQFEQLDFARGELERVNEALQRIRDGTYGISAVSGQPIPRERLEVQPTATTLVGESSKQPT
jgi:RNA polymerase-binding transcription factor DksA